MATSTNYVSKLIKVAEGEVGYLEKKSNSQLESKTANAGRNNFTKYAEYFDKDYPTFYNGKKQGYAWCDVFVDWCFVHAYGKEEGRKLVCQPLKSAGAGCKFSRNYYKEKGQLHMKDPKVGDQIFFYNTSKNDIVHTGIVYKVDCKYVYTIEGNTSTKEGVVANGGGVAKKQYQLSYYRIAGYGRPKYDKAPSKPKTVEVKVVTKGNNLNCRKKPTILSAKLGQFRNGCRLILLEKTNKKWYKVKGVCTNFKSITGYCSTKYLKIIK